MQSVSQAWKDEQGKTLIEAEGLVELVINVGNPNAQADASATDNGHTDFSNVGQTVHEEIKKNPKGYSTLERNLWLLNGTRKILPSAPPYGNNGYIGATLSDADGEFSVPPTITVSFSTVYDSILPGLTVTWGSAYEGEYAASYRVSAYNGEKQVFSQTVTDNVELTSIFMGDIQGYNKIKLEVLKWSKPFHRARIERLLIGIEKTYTKRDLFGYRHSMFVDPLSASLPKAEITFELVNLNGEYNLDNPQGANKYLMERQKIKARYGYTLNGKTEWIKAGTFFLSEWDCPQNGITATFTARDGIEYMTNLYTGPSSGTLADIINSAFEQAGLPFLDDGSKPWTIHPSLSGIQAAPDADLSAHTVAEVIQYAANAGCCVFYQDRDGRFCIEPLNAGTTDYRIDRFNGHADAEISLTKQLKAVNVNDGQATVSVGSVGEVQPLNNALISDAQAPIVARWTADYLKERTTVTGEYRADPRLDALDRVTNENQFTEKTVLITQIEYTYNGAFRGSYEGRASA